MKLSQKGQAAGLVGIILGGGILTAFLMLLNQTFVSKKKTSDLENANEKLGRKMESLLSKPSNDPLLANGNHADGDLEWVISTEPAVAGQSRLKKIVLRAKLANRTNRAVAESTGITGYKYNDF